ncbi:hypothetical protein [Zhihengliuella salsuginis]|uniref:Uncharacterized protein n=1 Tax=Zhihengliuella salsuginis TaxID=578222 RepID=A0ABQ3GB69_9MICC|nr:hypothetical protein [Zhihengliuella salsuginis]GHC99264.1 hypothetical protein GCM10008096_01230 [Zhihengliuella salsuginis]
MGMSTDAIVFAVVAHLVVIAFVTPGFRALTGARRAWTVKPPFNITQLSPRNTWPFMLVCVAAALLLSTPATYFEAVGDEAMRQLWWNLPFIWIPLPFIMLSFVWWPAKLAPRWYREWVERGGRRDVMPWTDAEIADVQALPEGRRKNKIMKDIDLCRGLTAAERAGK